MSKPILHHCTQARSFRCLWALEEAGFDADVRIWKFPPRVFDKAYKDINPLGTVPGWQEDGRLMTESVAICQRIAIGTSLELVPGDADYFAYLDWLQRADATLTFPQTIVLRYTRLEPPERQLPQAVEDYMGFFLGRARFVEAALEDGRAFLVAGRFTVADIAVGYAFMLARSLGIDKQLGPLTQSWLAGLCARPGYAAARAREGGKQLFG